MCEHLLLKMAELRRIMGGYRIEGESGKCSLFQLVHGAYSGCHCDYSRSIFVGRYLLKFWFFQKSNIITYWIESELAPVEFYPEKQLPEALTYNFPLDWIINNTIMCNLFQRDCNWTPVLFLPPCAFRTAYKQDYYVVCVAGSLWVSFRVFVDQKLLRV